MPLAQPLARLGHEREHVCSRAERLPAGTRSAIGSIPTGRTPGSAPWTNAMHTMNSLHIASAALVLALAAGTATPALATAARPALPTISIPAQDGAARSAERVLALADGRHLRGRTRQRADGVWELARGGEWHALEGVAVTSARLVSELLGELRTRRADQSRGRVPVHERLELAHWCESSGLVSEALEELDRALDDHPGDTRVERHLERFGERVGLAFGLPDRERLTNTEERERRAAVAAALATVARLGASGRHLAANALVRDAGWEAVASELAQDVRRAGPLGRRLACEMLGRFAPGDETKVLYVRALLDTDAGVRAAGARALGRLVDEPALVAPIERALASSNPSVALHAAQALGFMATPAAKHAVARAILAPPSSGRPAGPRAYVHIGTQHAYVQDFDVEVATAGSIADPQIGVLVEGSVLDVRVLSTVIERTVVQRHLVLSAERLAGGPIGAGPQEWSAWARATLAETEPAPTTPGGATPPAGS